MNQRALVVASVHADAGHDVGGPLWRHPTELDVLRSANARLEREVEMLRDGRVAFIEAYLEATGGRLGETG